MPTYLYQREDGTEFEIEQKISDPPLSKCPTTSQVVKRLITGTSFQLKGSGWYKTDYANPAPSKSSTEPKATEKKTDKPATKTVEKPKESASKE